MSYVEPLLMVLLNVVVPTPTTVSAPHVAPLSVDKLYPHCVIAFPPLPPDAHVHVTVVSVSAVFVTVGLDGTVYGVVLVLNAADSAPPPREFTARNLT